ncbi:hypothetical protein BgAZ_500560 [Babesia gibsoni]|uniref:Thioredoxin domain-containing protein n=1 Tax=Babesia gibsoni TaxID=33632 RepID=A0AAD8PCQ5_BABGI|nr:hypothetical protein BgAZ_500560 [Babesia gibsoni]
MTNPLAVAFHFVVTTLVNHAKGYLLVPNPPLATPLTEQNYQEFLRSQDQIGIVFQYPAYQGEPDMRITEFAIVTKILENNPKCKFGVYHAKVSPSSPAELMKPSLSYINNGDLISFRGNVNRIAEMLAWIAKERICDMYLPNLDVARYYVKSLEYGHVHTFILISNRQEKERIVNSAYDTVMSTGLRVPVMVVDNEDVVRFIFKRYHLPENVVKGDSLLVARNIQTLNSTKFYVDDLEDKEKLHAFLLKELIPPVHGTNSYMLDEVFTMEKIIVYIYTKMEMLEEYVDPTWMDNFAKKHSDKFIFIHSKGDPAVERRLNQLLVIDTDYIDTAVRAFEMHPDRLEFVKYKPIDLQDGSLSQVKLMNFVRDLRNGRIKHFVKSEPPVPSRINTGVVKVVVGEDFNHKVIESDEDVLILFYTPWSGHSHNAKRVFRDLGRRVKGLSSLLIANFDAFNNEVENVSLSAYPTVMLYPHGDKHKPLLYQGDIALEPLASFLEKGCKKQFISSTSVLEKVLSKEQLFEMHTEL